MVSWFQGRAAWQEGTTKTKQSMTGVQKAQTAEAAAASLPFPFFPPMLQAFWVVPPKPRPRSPIIHAQNYDKPISGLIQYITALILVSHT